MCVTVFCNKDCQNMIIILFELSSILKHFWISESAGIFDVWFISSIYVNLWLQHIYSGCVSYLLSFFLAIQKDYKVAAIV